MRKITDQYDRIRIIPEIVLEPTVEVANGNDEPDTTFTCSINVSNKEYSLSIECDTSKLAETFKQSRQLADIVVNHQTTLEPIVIKIKQKAIVGKVFAEFLVYLCNIFLRAIEKNELRLVRSSQKQPTMDELTDSIMILMEVKDKFRSTYTDQEHEEDSLRYAIPILIGRANKIASIIRNIWQPFWKRWSSSKIGTLLSIYEGITEVVKGIKDIDCKPFCDLIGDIKQLRACLDNIDTILEGVFCSQLIVGVALGAGSAICVILGAILIPTPAAPASIPLLVTGGALAWQTSVQIDSAFFTRMAVTGIIEKSTENGIYKGQQFMEGIKKSKAEASKEQ